MMSTQRVTPFSPAESMFLKEGKEGGGEKVRSAFYCQVTDPSPLRLNFRPEVLREGRLGTSLP